MKATLLIAGGMLLASGAMAATMTGTATATARPYCALEADHDDAFLAVKGDKVLAGTRDGEVCKRYFYTHHRWSYKHHDNYKHDNYKHDNGDDD